MTPTPPSPGPLLFLVGPTASGKKKVALAVADGLSAELLSLDSMKVYRGMDLGTDKAAGRRFLLTDLVAPSERFSVGAYVRAAQEEVRAVRARGGRPLFVGGTGLYLRALVRGLFEVPAISPAVRAEIGVRLDREGSAALHAELARVDPPTAARLHPNDRKRIARALEVWRETGRTLADWQATATRPPIEGTPLLVGLRFPRTALRQRIAERVDRMFAAGLIDEVRRLAATGAIGPVAALAIGYREVLAMFERGETEAQCRAAVVGDTIHFVRRQENWFRQFAEIRWVDAAGELEAVARSVRAEFTAALARPWTTGLGPTDLS